MGFVEDIFDQMSLAEVYCRLPGENAIASLKRRITNLDTLKMFFDGCVGKVLTEKELKNHINIILNNYTVDDILKTFNSDYHAKLFNWLDEENTKRIKSNHTGNLDLKLLFNITDSKDIDSLIDILNKILSDSELNQSHINAVLRKVDPDYINPLLDVIVKDNRPEVRACILSLSGLTKREAVSNMYKVIALKAFAKCPNNNPINHINVISIDIFKQLRPSERITALERYLSYFPVGKKVPAFEPIPSEEELKTILFAGCIEYYDRVQNIIKMYDAITKDDEPESDDE